MKVELFPFQKKALAALRMHAAESLGAYRRTHSPQVISFTAPTGAGKTIIMASLMESILFGDEQYPDQKEAIIVWLSDSPPRLLFRLTGEQALVLSPQAFR